MLGGNYYNASLTHKEPPCDMESPTSLVGCQNDEIGVRIYEAVQLLLLNSSDLYNISRFAMWVLVGTDKMFARAPQRLGLSRRWRLIRQPRRLSKSAPFTVCKASACFLTSTSLSPMDSDSLI